MWEEGSLFSAEVENFTLLYNIPVPDGVGGIIRRWTEGPDFIGVLRDDQGTTARIGAVQTGTTFGTIKTPKSVELKYHDAFKRKIDGIVYRVSGKNSNKTPNTSELDLRQYPVEQWAIPDDGGAV